MNFLKLIVLLFTLFIFSCEDTNSYKKIILYLNKFRYFRNGSFQLPIDININIKENQIIDFQKGLLISRLRIEFKKYSDIVCFNSESDKALFEISISNELLIIETPGSTGCVFHDVQKRDKETFIENLVLDIIIGIAMSLTSYGHFGFSNRILFFKKEILLKLLKSEESFNYLFNQIINSTFFVTFMKLIINFVRKKDISDEFIFIVQSSLILSTKTHTSKEYSLIEQFLLLLHQKALVSKDNEYIGSTLYNLGSHYRVREQYKKGAIYYIKAKRFCPRYLKQDYFFKELGGIFWFLKKYKVSAHCYKLGLEISFNINNLPLYADALMFAGEYEKSVEVFDKYFSEYNDIRSEWILKYTFLINIIHDYGYKNQNRIQFTLSKKINNILELEKELSRDALNPQIWRKLGLLYKEESEIDKAFFAFIFCALAQNHDIESWINATMCSFSPDIPIELLCHTVITAYFFNKDYYLENIYRIILESNEPKAYEMIDLIETLIKKVDKPKRIPQLRFPNKDGLYEDIVKDFLKDGL